MSEIQGKSYNQTAQAGAAVDSSTADELRSAREAKLRAEFGEEGFEEARQAAAATSPSYSGLYDETSDPDFGRGSTHGRLSLRRAVASRPIQAVAGAALVGFLLGRFG